MSVFFKAEDWYQKIVKSLQAFLLFELSSLGSRFGAKENERKGTQREVQREAGVL